MTDVNVQAILGSPPPPLNPLQTISGWQDYANKVAQNAQIRATTANTTTNTAATQQALQQARYATYAQHFASVLAAPDDQIPAVASRLLDQETGAGGTVPPALEAQLRGLIGAAQNGDTGALQRLKQTAIQGLVSNLTAPQQVAAQTPNVADTNIGGQHVARITPSAIQLMSNPNDVGISTNSAINNTLAPNYVNVGDAERAVGGAYGQPGALVNGTSPEQANQIQTIIDPNTGLPVTGRNAQLGGLQSSGVVGGTGVSGAPTAAPGAGGYRLPGYGTQAVPASTGGSPVGTGGKAPGGLLSNGPVTNNPQAQQNLQDTYTQFNAARQAFPALKTSEQTLIRASQLLQTAVTGPGTDKVQALRNYVSTLNQLSGGKINETDIAAANYDELGKDFSQLAAQASGGSHLVGNLDAIIHGNPNMMLNRLANSNVTAILLGQNRQKQLEYMLTKDQNSGRDFQQARQTAATLDPRALALDAMTPTMASQTVAELKKAADAGNPEPYNNFFRSIAIAKRNGLYKAAPPLQPASPAAAQ